MEQPLDIERNWDKAYAVELDYYFNFISKKLDPTSFRSVLNGENGQKRILPTPLRAEDEKRFKISLLSRNRARNIEQKDILKALTAKSAADVFDMERFELLGDAFLKFSVSFYLLERHQDWHEGYLSAAKARIVSNRNLFYLGALFGLPGMIKLHPFDPKNDWAPPLATVPEQIREFMVDEEVHPDALRQLEKLSEQEVRSGKVAEGKFRPFMQILRKRRGTATPHPEQLLLFQQSVGDKTVADCMEALLGVCLDSAGIEPSLRFLTHFGILPKNDDLVPRLLRDYVPRRRNCVSLEMIDKLLINREELEETLGYTFRDRSYLLQALTHPSYPDNHAAGCYQQLEFLGDAVLDFLISSYIFESYASMDPGQLTDLRSALVNNSTLACISVRNRFHLFLLFQNSKLSEIIQKFVTFQERHGHAVTDQIDLLATETDCPRGEVVDVPKVLGDIFESLVGAVFLDSGRSLETAWNVVRRLMHAEIDRFAVDVPKQLIRRLHEVPGAKPCYSTAFVHDDGVEVELTFWCRGEERKVAGFGQNKRDAKKVAAKMALQMFD